jgi:hypothetical protein
MRRYIYYFVLLFFTCGIISCNNDDFSDEPNDVISDENGDMVLKFSLLNVDGNETTSFKKKENIIFDLAIENRSNKDFIYHRNFEGDSDYSLDSDFFCVKTEKGKKVGVPWSGMFCEFSLQNDFTIPAGTTRHVTCSWLLQDDIRTTHPLCKGEDSFTPSNQPLSKGNYYTSFVVKYRAYHNDENLTEKKFTINFSVK